jgi:23S rRNA pseudouridine2605 synthase
MAERLQKVLAQCGVGSRRECETLIEQGRVEVDGKVVTKLGTKVEPGAVQIKVDGERVGVEERVYYLVNKPRGFVCTSTAERGDRRVIDLVPDRRRVYTVGRLDASSEGLVLLTNDGGLSNIICHPRYQVDKTYRLTVEGRVDPKQLERIEKGVWLPEGKSAPAQVRRVDRHGRSTVVTVTLWEGRSRELRRIFGKVGLHVSNLARIAIGPLFLGDMQPGAWRRLGDADLAFAHERMSGDWKPPVAWRADSGRPRRGGPPHRGRRRGRPGPREARA